MGNDHSKKKEHSEAEKSHVESSENPQLDAYFSRISDGKDAVSAEKLISLFDTDLAESLLKYFAGSKTEKFISREQFQAKFTPLYGTSMDIYVKILQPVHHFVKVCSDAAGASAIKGDEEFISNLVKNMTNGKIGEEATQEIIRWRRDNCEKFTLAAQNRVVSAVTGTKIPNPDYSSDILTPLQMWYVQSCLPNFYFPAKPMETPGAGHWTPLYTSLQHGISTNRFETLVFDYRGPTVTVFRLKDERVVVLASDQEWSFKTTELKIGKDFDEVLDIEVWGCAGQGTLAEQQKLKNWQKQQTEKHKKVPLPGNWDDNPDKTLLEMAGFQFSNERAAMEMEAKKREEEQSQSEKSQSEK
ncbi:Protein CBG15190 [Caenorhabditis briggsae]|uniref:Protein CBG15190 n=1 Tax=Caenorhabditis briggsae TaxID=6238 RepID=A8XLQ5_CAEBR|nr:Protein CBG15190 [Caenorhabditis briggsae]CAP33559.2 Protein CBG15190 [Caenorhabditis briggsae]